jgi:HSP20 family protein
MKSNRVKNAQENQENLMMTMYVSPYRRLANLQKIMDRVLDEDMTDQAPVERQISLPVDVRSDDEAFTIQAFVPGLDADDLNIEVLNNTVSIRGEFKSEEDENVKYFTCELPQGRFSRVITLPVDVDAAKVEAAIKNGMLQLRVPKAEVYRPRTIKVNVN